MESIVHHADCMDIMAQYPDKHFDLAVVDPPYGIDRNGMNMGNSIFNTDSKQWDKSIPESGYFLELLRVSKNAIVWGGNYFAHHLPSSQYFAIWDKGETMYGRDFAECEYAWVKSGGTRIFKKCPNQSNRIHPTQKPVKLYDWIYKNYLPEGGKVIDTHLGSGSNRIAADKAGNINFVGCELDKEYFDAQEKRWSNYKAQLTIQF
jgi:site-specific DNA-methyltransferase (adenine-specific)